jgi:hypothetical protein
LQHKYLALALLAAFVTASTAVCAAEPSAAIAKAFGNTIVSTYADGRTAVLWLSPDGTYRGLSRKRKPSSGTWRLSGERVCLRQAAPKKIFLSFCTPVPAGEAWSAKATNGEMVRLRLVSGAVVPNR